MIIDCIWRVCALLNLHVFQSITDNLVSFLFPVFLKRVVVVMVATIVVVPSYAAMLKFKVSFQSYREIDLSCLQISSNIINSICFLVQHNRLCCVCVFFFCERTPNVLRCYLWLFNKCFVIFCLSLTLSFGLLLFDFLYKFAIFGKCVGGNLRSKLIEVVKKKLEKSLQANLYWKMI